MRYQEQAAIVPTNELRTRFTRVHLLSTTDDELMACGWRPLDPRWIGHPVDFRWIGHELDLCSKCYPEGKR